MAIEEPTYTVETTTDNFEIRNYAPILVAETKIEEDFEDAGSSAFRILADYIFGNNRSKTKIEMTAPVSQQAVSEKIAMTAPVTQTKKGSGYTVQFTMPSKFSLETVPTPNDSRVEIKLIPARRMAVRTYSGSWSEQNYNEELEKLLLALKESGFSAKGEPVFARFNSPFRLWFLRRNEIWVELTALNSSK
ncbi:MAG: heme-binding protein [Bdellovibrionaceae bacterium]|nr:heme-binding protein [Pseudobdellovibrionaceae bacterium]